MAVYKVIQDIEAEDKLLGPLTLKQFIFAVIAAGFIFVAFMLVTKTGVIYLAIPFLPFIGTFGILAAPLSKDQPTDLWLAARIRFFIKPRKRIWDQSGLKELVTITVPKKEVKVYSDNLSQGEVKSRLEALANTLDSRGWALKNVAINMYANPSLAYAYDGGQDRLIDPSSLPQAIDEYAVNKADDIMDPLNNPTAQHFDEMVQASTASHKAQAVQHMHQAIQASQTGAGQQQANSGSTVTDNNAYTVQTPDGNTYNVSSPPNDYQNDEPAVTPDYSFINQQPINDQQPNDGVVFKEQLVSTNNPQQTTQVPADDISEEDTDIDEEAILDKIHKEKQQTSSANPHHKIIKTPEQLAQEAQAREQVEALESAVEEEHKQTMTAPLNPVNIELARSDDLSVETISKLANRKPKNADGEVVVNLR